MAGNPNDPRRLQAQGHINEAISLLELARSKALNHTDGNIVRAAIDSLGTVLRVMTSSNIPNDAALVTRLHQVASAVKLCAEPDASIAYADVENAAAIFRAITDAR